MKIGIVIPTRGDRHDFISQATRIAEKNLNYHSHAIIVVGESYIHALPGVCDITKRYRFGYDWCTEYKCDVIFFMEDDDWYAPDYIETMLKEWEKAGRPDLFGTRYTIYYHLKLRRYFTWRHDQRASAMNTMIKPGLKFPWPQDSDPYLDQWLWMHQVSHIKSKALFEPSHIHSIGMKHGTTMTGGKEHIDGYERYINDDEDMRWIEHTCDPASAEFYKSFSDRMRSGEIKQVGV